MIRGREIQHSQIMPWIGVAALIALEQGIKLVISRFFLNTSVPIVAPVLYFEPMFNRHYSWFNSMLRIGGSKWAHIGIVGILIVLLFLFYRYVRKHTRPRRIVNVMFAFLFAGALCSFVDKVFWDGSLDYIRLTGFFTFDLKDIYVNVFNGLLVYVIMFRSGDMKRFTESSIIGDFCRSLGGLRKPDRDGASQGRY